MTIRIRLTVNGTFTDGNGGLWTRGHKTDWGLNISTPGGETVFARAEVISVSSDDHYYWESNPSAQAALRSIVHKVKTAPNSFEAAGEWITRITNEITNAIREDDKP